MRPRSGSRLAGKPTRDAAYKTIADFRLGDKVVILQVYLDLTWLKHTSRRIALAGDKMPRGVYR
jgi:hypothetical protein